MSDPHTFSFLRKEERFEPALFDRRPYTPWEADGDTILDRAREKEIGILGHHEVPPLEEQLQNELDRIIQCADREFDGS